MQVVTYSTTTGDAALSFSVEPMSQGGSWRLLNISAKAHGEVATALIVELDCLEGAIYDTYLSSNTAWTRLYMAGEASDVFKNGDKLVIGCTDDTQAKSVVVRIELL